MAFFNRSGPSTCFVKTFANVSPSSALWNFVSSNIINNTLITPAGSNANVLITGDLTVDGHIYQLSDAKSKLDIKPISGDVISAIHQLNPVSFKNTSAGNDRYGFVADEVKTIFPCLVKDIGIRGNKQLTLDYIGLMPLIVGEVQLLRQKIEQLEIILHK